MTKQNHKCSREADEVQSSSPTNARNRNSTLGCLGLVSLAALLLCICLQDFFILPLLSVVVVITVYNTRQDLSATLPGFVIGFIIGIISSAAGNDTAGAIGFGVAMGYMFIPFNVILRGYWRVGISALAAMIAIISVIQLVIIVISSV